MSDNDPRWIGRSGRWLIFSGIPMAACAAFFVIANQHHALEHAVGQKAFPWVLAAVPAALIIAGIVLEEHFPKRLAVPCGTVGWLVTAAILCWFFWFGPGALKL